MSDQKIKFKIVTPEKTVFEQEVDQVTLPVIGGQVTILPNHRQYIAALNAGEIIAKSAGKEIPLVTSGGFVEFKDNTLILLADTAEHALEIDITRAEQARERAKQLKTQKESIGDMEYARVAAAIEKETARIHVARKHHAKRGVHID